LWLFQFAAKTVKLDRLGSILTDLTDNMSAILRPSSHRRYAFEVVVADPTRRESNGRARRRIFYFQTEQAAQKKMRAIGKSIMAAGVAGLDLTPTLRRDALDARAALDSAGYPSTTLAELALNWLRTQGAGPASRQLVTPYLDVFLEAKSQREGMAQRSRENLERRIGAWLDRACIVTLADLTRENCLALAERTGVEAATRRNDMNAASSFLSWLVQEQAIASNPLMGMRRPKVDPGTPTLYTSTDAHALLDAAIRYKEGKHARAVGLLFFAGLRPSEVEHTRLDLAEEEPAARVAGGKLRGRANRIVLLRANAAKWLRTQPEKIVVPTTGERRQIVKLAGVPWLQDAARHTWISARLAISNDENRTAREAGTSPDVIFRHYHRLMTKAEAAVINDLGVAHKSSAKPQSLDAKSSIP